jgi:hypothetical protein
VANEKSRKDIFVALVLQNSIILATYAILNESNYDIDTSSVNLFLADGLSNALPDIMSLSLGYPYSLLSNVSKFSTREIRAALSMSIAIGASESRHGSISENAEIMELMENSIYSYLYFMMLYSINHNAKMLFDSCLAFHADKLGYKDFTSNFTSSYEYTKARYLASRNMKLRQ